VALEALHEGSAKLLLLLLLLRVLLLLVLQHELVVLGRRLLLHMLLLMLLEERWQLRHRAAAARLWRADVVARARPSKARAGGRLISRHQVLIIAVVCITAVADQRRSRRQQRDGEGKLDGRPRALGHLQCTAAEGLKLAGLHRRAMHLLLLVWRENTFVYNRLQGRASRATRASDRAAAHLQLLAENLHDYGGGHGWRVPILLNYELSHTLLQGGRRARR
jgi:hypothetical protein